MVRIAVPEAAQVISAPAALPLPMIFYVIRKNELRRSAMLRLHSIPAQRRHIALLHPRSDQIQRCRDNVRLLLRSVPPEHRDSDSAPQGHQDSVPHRLHSVLLRLYHIPAERILFGGRRILCAPR